MAHLHTWLDHVYLLVHSRRVQLALPLIVICTLLTSMTLLHVQHNRLYRVSPTLGDVYALEAGRPLKYWNDTSGGLDGAGVFRPAPDLGSRSMQAHVASRNPWHLAQRWIPKSTMEGISSLRYPYCPELIAGNPHTKEHALKFMEDHFPLIRADEDYVDLTRNCSRFLEA
ncbi:hypothetical protein ACOMHN_022834 [Nucella lapillus]